MPNRTCVVCNKDFFIHQWRLNNTRTKRGQYCSVKCRTIGQKGEKGAHWQGGKPEMDCELCGNNFTYSRSNQQRRRFCSQKCKYKWMRSYMSRLHSIKHNNGKPIISVNKHNTYEYRALRRQLIQDYKYCFKCGGEEKLEFDHILPVFIYPEMAYDIRNVQLLCRPCHKAKTSPEKKLIAEHRQKLKVDGKYKSTRQP